VVGNPEFLIGQALADEFVKIGLDVQVRSYQSAIATTKRATGDFDMHSYWLCGVSFDPNQLYSTLQAEKAVPIGQTATQGNEWRVKDPDLTAASLKLDVTDPTDPGAKALFDQALTAYYKQLAGIPVIQTTYPSLHNTTYWTGWPTDEDLYQVPLNWWGQFLFVIGKIKPTGRTA
jgi:peptide/nickel transport system substrate-binding protein